MPISIEAAPRNISMYISRCFSSAYTMAVFQKIVQNVFDHGYTDEPDCYGPPKMLILVFIKFRENQE